MSRFFGTLIMLAIAAMPAAALVYGGTRPTTIAGRDIEETIPKAELPLQKMRNGVSQHVSVDGSWFLFGSVSANAGPDARVYFSWPLQDGSYVISSLPIERIRVRTAEHMDNPTIRFELQKPKCVSEGGWPELFATLQEGIDSCVAYATITCAAKDWQPSVDMPLK